MHAVGGVEKELPSKLAKEGEGESQGVAQGSGGAQMGQIIRDDAGNVIEVRLPESDSGEGSNKGKAKDESTPWGKPLDAGVVETPTVPLTFDDELKRGKHASDTDAVKSGWGVCISVYANPLSSQSSKLKLQPLSLSAVTPPTTR